MGGSSDRSSQIRLCLALAALHYGGRPRTSAQWSDLVNEVRDDSELMRVVPRGLGQVFASLHRNGTRLLDGMQVRRHGDAAPYLWEVLDEEGGAIRVPRKEPEPEPEPVIAGPPPIEGLTTVSSQEHSIYLDGPAVVRALQMLGYSIPTDSATVSAMGTGAEVILGLADHLQIRVSWITINHS